MTAALLRKEACTNSPARERSLRNSLAPPQIAQKQMELATAQNSTYSRSNTARMSTAEISRNSMNGNVTLKLNLLATVTKSPASIPICFKNQPNTITRKIGIVTLMLKIKFSISISPYLYITPYITPCCNM